MSDSSSHPDTAGSNVEDQLAELKAVVIGLYDMMRDQQAETTAALARQQAETRVEIERLHDAYVQTQRSIAALRAAFEAHLPTLTAYLPLQAAHHSVSGSGVWPSGPEDAPKRNTSPTR